MTDTVDPCNIDPFRDFCAGTVKYPDPKGRKTVLLVDADILLYQLTSEATVEQYEGNNEYTYRLNMETVKANFESRHREMARDFDAERILYCFSSAPNWRFGVMPTYKSNRIGRKKPLGYAAAVSWVENQFDSCRMGTMEADDVIAILATKPSFLADWRKIAVSEDKDFKQIPGLLFNPGHPELGVVEISEAEADLWHMTQTLTGDSTDGYPGCTGVGPAGAKVILDGCTVGSKWPAIVKAYEAKKKAGKAPQTAQDALNNARVARLLRYSDLDANGAIKLWEPQ